MRRLAFVVLALAGCNGPFVYSCLQDGECVRPGQTGGRCVASPDSGSRYCAFIDQGCGGGMRFDPTAGDGLAGRCTDDVPGDMGVGTPDLAGADLAGMPPDLSGQTGLTWKVVSSPTMGDLYSIGGYDDQHVWAVGYDGIYFSGTGGMSWTLQNAGVSSQYTGVWAQPGQAFVVGYFDLLHSTNDGADWSAEVKPVGASNFHSVSGTAPDNLFAVGTGGTIAHRTGNGWLSQTSGVGFDRLNAVWGASDRLSVWAVGSSSAMNAAGPIVSTTDGGNQWNPSGAGVKLDFFGVWGSGPNDVYVVGAQNVILHGGTGMGWSQANKPTNNPMDDLDAIWGSGPNDVYAVGNGGLILHSGDGGQSWQPQQSPTSTRLLGIWGTSGKSVYAVGESGVVLHGAP